MAADSATCATCDHANREHAAPDVDGSPCYTAGCDCWNFVEVDYSSPRSWQPDSDQETAAALLTHELGAELIEALQMLDVSNKKGIS